MHDLTRPDPKNCTPSKAPTKQGLSQKPFFQLKALGPLNKIEDQCLDNFDSLFMQRVEQCPDATAIIFHEDYLTYKQLDEKSNQFAHFLKKKGVKSGSIVGVSRRPDLHFTVIVLGILKAGGVYLPLDPSYPEERLHSMCEDTSPQLIVVEADSESLFIGQSTIVSLDKEWNAINAMEREAPPEMTIKPDDLAYIIYTSGSTGKPKGIMIQHSSLYQVATSHQPYYPKDFRAILVGAIGFDSNIKIIVHSLTVGGVICIPDHRKLIDFQKTVAFIKKHSVNFLLCVPSFYSKLLDQSPKLPTLEHVSLAGEGFSHHLVDLHTKFAPNAVLYNNYGPSEYAIGTTLAKIYDPIEGKAKHITIGRSLPDTQVYILGHDKQPVPVGVKGEIYISGRGLAKGYLNKPSVTDEKFVWVSFANQLPLRFYRSGDLGRFLEDGQIEFLGREDHQVKLKGYRIELGEIEYTINQHKDVKDSIVMVQGTEEGKKRLVAYFSATSATTIEDTLRTYLYRLLPYYMVPTKLIQIELFPHTANGKIDREELSKKGAALLSANPKVTKPHSPLIKTMQGIWKQALKRDLVGIDDNFFDIGGDSLLAMTTQTLIEETFGLKLATTDLFRFPTIRTLAQQLDSQTIKKIDITQKQKLAQKKTIARRRFKKYRKQVSI